MRYRRLRIEGAAYFFTVVTYQRRPILQSEEAAGDLMSCLRTVQDAHPFQLDAYVILPDHFHMIWTLPEGDSDYPMRWRHIKSAFTRKLKNSEPVSRSRELKSERAVWQRRYWEHTITSEADFTAHVEYVHFNPVRHGLAAAPVAWPHSSFHDWVKRGLYDRNWGSDDPRLAPLKIPE